MGWLAIWTLVALVGAPRPVERTRLSSLPPPVGRYLERAGHEASLGEHGPGPARRKLPHEPRREVAADSRRAVAHGRPARLRLARTRRAAARPVVDARDRSVDGAGNMLVKLQSTLTLADSRGPELDVVPHLMTARRHVDGADVAYARFVVESITYDGRD